MRLSKKLIGWGCLAPLTLFCVVSFICLQSGVNLNRFFPRIPNPMGNLKTMPTIEWELNATSTAIMQQVQTRMTQTPIAIPTFDPALLPTIVPLPPTPSVEDMKRKLLDQLYPNKQYLPVIER